MGHGMAVHQRCIRAPLTTLDRDVRLCDRCREDSPVLSKVKCTRLCFSHEALLHLTSPILSRSRQDLKREKTLTSVTLSLNCFQCYGPLLNEILTNTKLDVL